MATAVALRQILLGLRAAGRRVVVHLPVGADTLDYFIASAGERVSAFPGASIELAGFASRGIFVRQALAKVGVVAEVLARGKYKSAGDALTRDAMSGPQREQLGALLDAMYATLRGGIVDARGLTPSEADAAVDRAIFRTPDAVTAKLVDASLFDDQVVGSLGAIDAPPPCVAAPRYLRARRATRLGRDRGTPCIGVVRVHGVIAQGRGTLLSRGAMSDAVIAAVRAAREDKKVRGVVLHIDSPGGSALASAQMHRELELLASEKPLVACMANVAASGGYYVAAPAHAIVAEPVTITGSIGVIAARFALGPLFDRLGVTFDIEKRGARADLHDAVRPLSDADRSVLMAEIEGTYQEFIDVVARGRKKSADEVENLAQGRVWSGVDARARGLVDHLGGFDVALSEVRRRVGGEADGLAPRVVDGGRADRSLRLARPSRAGLAWSARAAEELLGEWAGLLQLAFTAERVLAWDPDLTSNWTR